MNHWYHVDCLLASFKSQRASTKSLESVDDVTGWDQIGDLERDELLEKFGNVASFNKTQSVNTCVTNNVQVILIYHFIKICVNFVFSLIKMKNSDPNYKEGSEDNLFRTFQRICNQVAAESSYLGKSAILNKFFKKVNRL